MDWRHSAACRDEDPELFFPIGNTGPALLQIEEAKVVCRRCTVADTCRQWAYYGQAPAVGWPVEDERRALKRRPRSPRARTPNLRRAAATARTGECPSSPCSTGEAFGSSRHDKNAWVR